MGGRLAGRRVLVTGASAGIGRAVAEACAAEDAAVAVLARRGDRLRAMAESLGAVPVVGDVTDPHGVAALVDEAADRLGGLDALVNSAGIMRPGLVADADPADWRAMFDVNVLGLLAVTKACIPHLRRAATSSIVNISSMSGRRVPAPESGTYAATKFAVHAISEGLRQELQPHGVRVTTIAPGFVATELFSSQPSSPLVDSYQAMAERTGMAAADVGEAVVHVLAAPPGVTTVEVALVPTSQDDRRYGSEVAGED